MRIALVCSLLLFAGLARADPADPVTAAPRAVSAESPWELYDQAFAAAAAGKDAEALALVQALAAKFPGSAAALLGGELARLVTSRQQGSVQPADPLVRTLVPQALQPPVPAVPHPPKVPGSLEDFLRNEKPTGFARGELTFIQTLNGVGLGIETCLIADCNDARAGIAAAIVGGGAGAAAALGFSQDGITAGHALAIDSGTAWGLWQGIALGQILDVNSRAGMGILASGQILGTIAGHLVWTAFPVGAGDVSLANTGGIWGGVLTLWIDSIIGGSNNNKVFFGSLLAGSDLGLLAGAALSRIAPMSRGRTFLLDAGGVLGMLLGMGLEVLVAGTADNDRAFGTAATIGIVGGLATAGILTENFDLADVPDAKVAIAPVPGGGAMLTAMLVR